MLPRKSFYFIAFTAEAISAFTLRLATEIGKHDARPVRKPAHPGYLYVGAHALYGIVS